MHRELERYTCSHCALPKRDAPTHTRIFSLCAAFFGVLLHHVCCLLDAFTLCFRLRYVHEESARRRRMKRMSSEWVWREANMGDKKQPSSAHLLMKSPVDVDDDKEWWWKHTGRNAMLTLTTTTSQRSRENRQCSADPIDTWSDATFILHIVCTCSILNLLLNSHFSCDSLALVFLSPLV